MARSSVYKKLARFGRVILELRKRTQTDKQTKKQADILITIFRTPPAGEVKVYQPSYRMTDIRAAHIGC